MATVTVLKFATAEGANSALSKVQDAGGKLILCGIHPDIYEVFVITKLDRLFVVRRDEQEALQSF